ncbi:MAG: glycosyltransferase family 4 protein [Deltaproteobacteria bacterium]
MSGEQRLRILHIVQAYPPAIGGTEKVIAELSRRLVRDHGDRVSVFTSDALSAEAFARPDLPRLATGSHIDQGVEVRRFRSFRAAGSALAQLQRVAWRLRLPGNETLRTFFQGPILPGLARAIREHDADVVVASSFPLLHMYTALDAARASGKACVLLGALHPDDRWGFDRARIYRAIRAADRYIAYTDYERQHVLANGAVPERTETIGLGVDLERFAAADGGKVRAELGLAERTPLIGFLGQLAPHKGVDLLLQALPQIWQKHPEAHCLIAGATTTFQPEIDRLRARLPSEHQAQLHLRPDFPESAKPDLFAAIDILAYPSRFESFGLAYLEAWAAGKAVVGCRIPAVEDVVEDGRTGLLIPPGDRAALANGLTKLLESPDRRAAFGAAGRARVEESHSWAAVTQRFRLAYQRAATSP